MDVKMKKRSKDSLKFAGGSSAVSSVSSLLSGRRLFPENDDIWVTIYDGELRPMWSSRTSDSKMVLDGKKRRGAAYHQTLEAESQVAVGRVEVFTKKALERGVPQFGIRSQKGPDGMVKYVQVISVPFQDEQNRVREVLEVVTDITEKRLFEEKLYRSEKHYRGLFDHSAMAVALCSDQFFIYNANQKFVDMFGFERSEIVGRVNFLDMVTDPAHRDILRKHLRLLPQTFEVELTNKRGECVIVQAAVDQIPVSGEIILSLADVTAQRKLEEEIRSKDQYLLTVLDGSADAILSVDANHIIKSWNKGAEIIFGFTKEEAIGRPLTFLIPPDLMREHEAISKRVVEKGRVGSYETKRLTRDGRIVDVSITRTLVRDESGSPMGYSVIARDISEEAILRKRLVQAERMTKLGELSASLAHEIKNPLNSIIITLEVLKSRVSGLLGSLGGSVEKYFTVITEEIKRLDGVIKNFLDFANPEKEKRMVFHLSDLVREVCDLIGSEARQKGINVMVGASSEVKHEIYAQRGQIKQAVLNLVLNAMQAMPHGGELEVKTDYDPKTKEKVVVVRDTGVGISKEKLPKIFDLYFTTKEKGSGLGLPIVQRVMHGYGGRVEVESEEGKGTTFRLVFPILGEGGAVKDDGE